MNKGNILQSSTWSNSMNSNQTPSSSSSSLAMSLWHDSCQEVLPESWSQLLLGGSMSEVERCGLMSSTPNYQSKKMESWEDQMVVYHPSASADRSNDDVNQEGGLESRSYYFGGEEIQLAARASWAHQINNLPASSPRSCVTTSFGSGMLDFSNNKAEKRHLSEPLDQHECNSTERDAASKKTRVQVSCSAQSPFKVRKEKLGDRITALHQLVSPFGKTDTASVLLEAIGYIRFLQNQIEALSSPYLVSGGSDNTKQPGAQGRSCIFPEDPGQLLDDNFTKKRGSPDLIVSNEPKDLRSRGLCLVPLSCTLHVGSDNGADYWAASFGTGFR